MTNKIDYTIIAESNGHHWMRNFGVVYCRDCSLIRMNGRKQGACRGVWFATSFEDPMPKKSD